MTNKDKTIKQFEFLIVNKIAKMATVKQCYLLDDLLCSFTHTINIQANDMLLYPYICTEGKQERFLETWL